MKALIAPAAICVLALFYLNTASVMNEGWGVSLVFRPFHGLMPFYGGGEEGSWRRAHPGEPDPWWRSGAFTRLAYFDDEGGTPAVMIAYGIGYYATVLGIVGLLIYYLVCHLTARRRRA